MLRCKLLFVFTLVHFFSVNSTYTGDTEFLKIAGTCCAATSAYGVLHDQVTARLSPEYFNSNAVPHHKALLDNVSHTFNQLGWDSLAQKVKHDPTVIALIWGVAATGLVGFINGITTATTCRIGSWPKLTLDEIRNPLILAMISTGLASFAAGYFGKKTWEKNYSTITFEDLYFDKRRQSRWAHSIKHYVPHSHQKWCFSNGYSHKAAYLAGGINALILNTWVLYKRWQKKNTITPDKLA